MLLPFFLNSFVSFKNMFIYAGSLLLLKLLSNCREWGLLQLCTGFSLWWLLLLQSTGSRAHGFQKLQHRLSSCGARAQLICSMWDLPRPGIKPVSLASADSFFTTEQPGKPCRCFLYSLFGCTGSQLHHGGSSVFIAACRVFSCGMQTLSCSL